MGGQGSRIRVSKVKESVTVDTAFSLLLVLLIICSLIPLLPFLLITLPDFPVP